MVSLFDINALVALAWPNHVHHVAAREWFRHHHADGWATSSVTETGFVRVSSNPRATGEAKTPGEAVLLLRELIAIPGHEFWSDDVSIALSDDLALERLTGHRQVSDAHLLLLAMARGGRLVTFDRGLRQLLPAGSSDQVLHVLGNP